MKTKLFWARLVLLVLALTSTHIATAQGTGFTYQGRLNDGANPAGGIYDLRLSLYDAAGGGAQQGVTLTNTATAVSNGLFTVTVDFGNQFPGAERWLEIGVRTNGGGAFTMLTPRQQLTATPYAVQAANATTASSVSAANITGALALSQLPTSLITNGADGVNLIGTFSGAGGGLTNVPLRRVDGGDALSFAYATRTTLGVAGSLLVASADFNGDGRPDLASVGSIGGVSVLINNGAGGFAPLTVFNPFNGFKIGLGATDLNGDGWADLVLASGDLGGGSCIVAYTNTGAAAFSLASSNYLFGPGGFRSMAVGQMNGDPYPDVVVGNTFLGVVNVFVNNGQGAFSISAAFQPGSYTDSIALADVNGNGSTDIVTTGFGPTATNAVYVATNNGSASFNNTTTYPVGGIPVRVLSTDLNGDGWPDIVTAHSGNMLTLLTNNLSGGFLFAATFVVGSSPTDVIAKDLTGDGRPDLIAVNSTDGTLSILVNQGGGHFTLSSSPVVGASPRRVIAVDVDGDGQTELITANGTANTLTVLSEMAIFTGNGSALIGLNATNLVGTIASGNIAANTIGAAHIADGTIANADISASAAIADTKLATISTAGKVSDTALSANVALLNRTPQNFTGTNTFDGNVGIGTTNPAALLHLESATPLSERLRLSGAEYYQGNTSTQGISLLLGVNRTDNRQLWIADSARLGQSPANPALRLHIGSGASIDSIATDGLTLLPLSLGPSALMTLNTNGNVGIGTTSPATQLDVNGNATTRGFNIVAATIISPANGATISPTSGYVTLAPGVAVTLNATTAITPGTTPGQMLLLRGTSDTGTVTINDLAGTALGANRTLGLNDTLSLIWTGFLWVEVSFANN